MYTFRTNRKEKVYGTAKNLCLVWLVLRKGLSDRSYPWILLKSYGMVIPEAEFMNVQFR